LSADNGPYAPGVTKVPKKPAPSSDDLKTNVANFMTRADKVLAHPVAEQPPSFQVLFNFDPETTILTSIDIDWENIDEASWLYLAILMRPIVFNQTDPISFGVLAKAIAREHPALGQVIKQGRKEFASWRQHMYVGEQNMGPVREEHEGLPSGTVIGLELGDPDTVPDSIDLDQMVPDYVLANIFLNGQVWHSDTDKAAEFQVASRHRQAFYAKCAEIRTVTAIAHVRNLREFIVRTRSLGYDY
jgi:hypothetical protein